MVTEYQQWQAGYLRVEGILHGPDHGRSEAGSVQANKRFSAMVKKALGLIEGQGMNGAYTIYGGIHKKGKVVLGPPLTPMK